MFKCDGCKTQQASGVKPHRVVAEKREKTYMTAKGDVLGVGWEIVKEHNLCGGCFGAWERVVR